jgi:hypothetical protein
LLLHDDFPDSLPYHIFLTFDSAKKCGGIAPASFLLK